MTTAPYVLIAPADDTRAFQIAQGVAAAEGLTEYRSMPMVYHEWSTPEQQPPPRPWWETASPGAALTVTGSPTAVYTAPGGPAWTRAPLPAGAAGIQFWGYSGEWIRILQDRPPTFPGGLWVRAGDVRLG